MSLPLDLENQNINEPDKTIDVKVRFLIYIGKQLAPTQTSVKCSSDATVNDLIDRLGEVYGKELKETIHNQRFLTIVDGLSISYRSLDDKINPDNKTSVGVTFLPVIDQGG